MLHTQRRDQRYLIPAVMSKPTLITLNQRSISTLFAALEELTRLETHRLGRGIFQNLFY